MLSLLLFAFLLLSLFLSLQRRVRMYNFPYPADFILGLELYIHPPYFRQVPQNSHRPRIVASYQLIKYSMWKFEITQCFLQSKNLHETSTQIVINSSGVDWISSQSPLPLVSCHRIRSSCELVFLHVVEDWADLGSHQSFVWVVECQYVMVLLRLQICQ